MKNLKHLIIAYFKKKIITYNLLLHAIHKNNFFKNMFQIKYIL